MPILTLCLITSVSLALVGLIYGLSRLLADLQPDRPDEGKYESQAK